MHVLCFSDSLPGEVWKQYPGAHGYYASSMGRFVSIKKGTVRIVKGSRDKDGYLRSRICTNSGKKKLEYLHRIIAITFIGPVPNKMQVCHNDGSKDNNKVENLRYDTVSGNHADKNIHGTASKGEMNPNHKLKAGEVALIKKLRRHGYTCKFVGKMFNVKQLLISRITRGIFWGWVPSY